MRRLECNPELLSALPERLVRADSLGDITLSPPGARQRAVLDDSYEVVEEIAIAAVPGPLMGFGIEHRYPLRTKADR